MVIKRLLSSSLLAICVVCGALIASGCASTQSAADRAASGGANDESVEVGYGTQDRASTTGAISTVEGDKVRERRAAMQLSDLLEGSVAGVHVSEAGGGIQVRIRGTNSIYGSSAPLYVVDGMPVTPGPGGTLHSINPYDVESITVLKDAAATAIYGSRGASGVIIIKTKSQ
jgi:TonB-dependent SusC/RagA subfamily outer membrane receptor